MHKTGQTTISKGTLQKCKTSKKCLQESKTGSVITPYGMAPLLQQVEVCVHCTFASITQEE
jgi:hypothetical protein